MEPRCSVCDKPMTTGTRFGTGARQPEDPPPQGVEVFRCVDHPGDYLVIDGALVAVVEND